MNIPKVLVLFFLSTFSIITFSQVQNISADNSVYEFLKRMQLKGFISNYDNTILPLKKSVIVDLLYTLRADQEKLTTLELDKVSMFLDKFDPSLADSVPSTEYLINTNFKNIISYSDSNIHFLFNPIAGSEYINFINDKSNALLVKIGGSLTISYKNWFGFYLKGTNGFLKGDRSAGTFNRNVLQSFTFNQTNINYFDFTEGYAKFSSTHLDFQLGRERIFWGTGFNNRLLLSDNPPIFDFIKFDFVYKNFSYNFLHGWLVRNAYAVPIDSLYQAKLKDPKYIALSRLAYKPLQNLTLGVSQAIIYGERPFEAAYLNPFLFWESAQRSLNDLDNSFLIFDGRYRPVNAIELSTSFLIDDVDFDAFGDWGDVRNSYAYQAGIMLTDPLLLDNMTLKVEYLLIRPYVFSHRGFTESLSYSNNGYLLGPPLQPNSVNISTSVGYDLSYNLQIQFQYSNTRHGANYYDNEGNLIKNYGGNMLESLGFFQDRIVPTLAGKRETINEFRTGLLYELIYGLKLHFVHIFRTFRSETSNEKDHILLGNILLDLE